LPNCIRWRRPRWCPYFSKDLEENKANNDVNKVTDVKLLQGDLAEAWREGETDFASVAMRFSLVDKTMERTTGRLVSGSDTPVEATEVWTFARRRGAGLGTLGDPADQLIATRDEEGAAFVSRRLFSLQECRFISRRNNGRDDVLMIANQKKTGRNR
jgi:hypothetical protein